MLIVFPKFALLLAGAYLFVTACADSTMVDGARQIAVKKHAEEEDGGGEEPEEINEPVMIGGTFLACVQDRTVLNSETEVGVGCRLERGTRKQILVHSSFETEITFVGTNGVPVEIVSFEMPAADYYNWILYLPKAIVDDGFVRANFRHKPDDLTQSKVASVRNPY